MDVNNVFYDHQHGLRRKHSTQPDIITLVEIIKNSLSVDDIVIQRLSISRKQHS